jgi:hypothetical protein
MARQAVTAQAQNCFVSFFQKRRAGIRFMDGAQAGLIHTRQRDAKPPVMVF